MARLVATAAAVFWITPGTEAPRAAAASASASRDAAAPAPVTFARDVAPILLEHCATCHRPDGPAPFSLLTFEEVRPRAKAVAAVVQRRTMPPWKPEPGYGEFIGSRRLTDDQIATIVRWARDDAPLGDPAALPSARHWTDGWQLGPPDLVVKMPDAYRLPPDGPDRLRNFVIPIRLPDRRYVKGWEFRTSNSRVVHHATMMIDPTRASQQRDTSDPEPGYEGLIPLSAKNPEGYFLGWTPGQTPSMVPDRVAWPLEKDSDLVVMLHLRPTGQWETVEASVALYFSESPPTETPVMIRLNQQDIDIPPGERHYTVADSYVLPVDVDAYSVQPHAHYLAKEMKSWATLPDGARAWLLYIRNWDFHWQDAYRFSAPVRLPAGTRVSMEYTYDNSEANPVNPSRPPKRVTFGQRTFDEMGDLWIQVLPRDASAAAALNGSLRRKLLPQNIAGYRMMLEANPDNVGLHDDLALLFSEAGDLESAAKQFAESVRLRPREPATQYNLGRALLALGRGEDAEAHFKEALEADPGYAFAHFGLALEHARRGRPDEAIREFREAVHLAPSFAEAYYNLGVLLQLKGDADQALTSYSRAVQIDPAHADAHMAIGLVLAAKHQSAQAVPSFRTALELRPDWPAAELQLAWVLATSPDAAVRNGDEAAALAQHAAASASKQDAHALDVLAATLAAQGHFDRAVAAAQRALAALEDGGDAATAAAIRHRLEMYRDRRPYIEEESLDSK